jgi:methylenetetrahydrofolate dehydrogenase (NAD+)
MPRVDVSPIAANFDAEIRGYVTSVTARSAAAPLLVSFLANADPAALMYAKMTRRACERNGVRFELREVDKFALEEAVVAANSDPAVHGILVYYPVFGGSIDDYLRDVISYEKDVEGLNHRYRYSLYHDIRHLDDAATKKCVLPCTPLAVVKILENLGAYDRSKPVGQQLSGTTAIVYNRSEVVGRPLGAMLANDGALVYSVDVTGLLAYSKGRVAGTIKVAETDVTTEQALAAATIVISGVPSKSFSLPASGIRKDAFCVNFSQHANFGEGVETQAAQYVPAIGKVTIAMLERNLVRLHQNFHDASAAAEAAVPEAPVRPPARAVACAFALGVAAAGMIAVLASQRRRA